MQLTTNNKKALQPSEGFKPAKGEVQKGIDRILSIGWMTQDDFDNQYKGSVLYLCGTVIGKGVHRDVSILGKSFGLKATTDQPSIYGHVSSNFVELEKAGKAIERLLKMLATQYSTDLKVGQDIGMALIERFQEMSFMDWAIFYNMAVSGAFQSNFQVVSARGITREFVFTWVKDYVFKKWQAIESLKNGKIKHGPIVQQGTERSTKAQHKVIVEKEMSIKKIEAGANRLRSISEQKLKSNPKKQGLIFANFILNHISEIVHEDTKKAKKHSSRVIDKIMDTWAEPFSAQTNYTWEEYCAFRATSFIIQSKKALWVNHYDLLVQSLSVFYKSCESKSDFAAKIYGKGTSKTMSAMTIDPSNLIRNSATFFQRKVTKGWPEYLKKSVSSGIAPLRKKEYLSISARKLAYSLTTKDQFIEAIKTTYNNGAKF